MKALTIREPWATLIQAGAKRVETRSWQTRYRGPLAIHAGKTFTKDAQLLCGDPPFAAALAGRGLNPGRVLALCRLDRVVKMEADTPRPSEPERSFGDFSTGRFAWVLADVRPIVPGVEARGKQGLWTVGDELRERIERNIADPETVRMYPPRGQSDLFPAKRRQRSALER